MKYKRGDKVSVLLPAGTFDGETKEVIPNYGFSGSRETKYVVNGKGFTTITSERCILS